MTNPVKSFSFFKIKKKSLPQIELLLFDMFPSVFFSALSLIMMVVIRYITKVLVWILTVLVIIGSIGNHRDLAVGFKQ